MQFSQFRRTVIFCNFSVRIHAFVFVLGGDIRDRLVTGTGHHSREQKAKDTHHTIMIPRSLDPSLENDVLRCEVEVPA